jgi:hypothetical protein
MAKGREIGYRHLIDAGRHLLAFTRFHALRMFSLDSIHSKR